MSPILYPVALSAPSRATINLLNWKDEQEQHKHAFRLVDEVSAKWREFGILLGLTTNQLDAYEQQNRGCVDTIWNRVMEYWLSGKCSEYPASWDGLSELLVDVKCQEVAKELKQAVLKCCAARSLP